MKDYRKCLANDDQQSFFHLYAEYYFPVVKNQKLSLPTIHTGNILQLLHTKIIGLTLVNAQNVLQFLVVSHMQTKYLTFILQQSLSSFLIKSKHFTVIKGQFFVFCNIHNIICSY